MIMASSRYVNIHRDFWVAAPDDWQLRKEIDAYNRSKFPASLQKIFPKLKAKTLEEACPVMTPAIATRGNDESSKEEDDKEEEEREGGKSAKKTHGYEGRDVGISKGYPEHRARRLARATIPCPKIALKESTEDSPVDTFAYRRLLHWRDTSLRMLLLP